MSFSFEPFIEDNTPQLIDFAKLQMAEKHMKAVRVKERQLENINPAEWIMEEKFKGIRVWRIQTPEFVKLISHGGLDISDKFPHLLDRSLIPFEQITQLDCELFDPNQEDEVVSGWAFTKEINPKVTSDCVLKIFDILSWNNLYLGNATQEQRKKILHIIYMNRPLEKVSWYPADKHREYYQHIIDKGGEGIMLKKLTSTYLQGSRRVEYWLKRKRRETFDCVVLGFTKGKGKYEGLVGAAEVGQYINGKLKKICNVSGMSDAVRQDMTLNPLRYLNKVCELNAMEQDQKSFALIEPSWKRLRFDKSPEDCTPN